MKQRKAPAKLGTAARRLWDAVTGTYDLEGHHLEILETACRALDRAERCREQIDADGECVLDRFDQRKAHPLLQPERDSRGLCLRALRDLGLDVEIVGRN